MQTYLIRLITRLSKWEPLSGGDGERAITWGYFATLLLATLAGYIAFNNVAQIIAFSSDGLLQEDYLRDLFERGVDVRTWTVTAISFFQDLWVYALIRFSTGSVYLAFVGLSLIKVIFYVVIFYSFLSLTTCIQPIRKLWFSLLSTSVMLLATIFLANQLGVGMITLFADFAQLFTMMSHGSNIANAAIAILLTLLWLRDPSKGHLWLFLLFVLSITASFSDRLYVVVFVAPAMGAVVILSVLGRVSLRSVVWFGSVILLSDVIGQKLYHLLGPIPMVAYNFSLIGGWKPVYEFYISTYSLGWYYPVVLLSYICLIGVTIRVFFHAWKARSQQDHHVQSFDQQETAKLFLLPYAVLVMPVSFLAMALINRPGTYNSGGNLLALSLWAFLLVMSHSGLRLWAKGWFHVAIITTLVVYVGALATSSPAPLSRMLSPSYPDSKVGACLDTHANELGDGAGIADYWLARKINLFSKKGLRIDQAQGEELMFFQWNSNREVLVKRKHTFVVTDFPSNLLPMREVDMVRIYGQPDARFVCDGYPVLVYKNGLKNG